MRTRTCPQQLRQRRHTVHHRHFDIENNDVGPGLGNRINCDLAVGALRHGYKIGIFIHPITDVRIRAHLFLSVIDDTTTDSELRSFQQSIIAQDKIILENHIPRRMPLDPGAEVPIRADATSIAYRRWLTELGVTYGVVPVGS